MYGCSRSVKLIRKFKNIDLLKNRNKKNIVCVDKSLLPYLNHISNFVPILPFRPSDYKSSKRTNTEGRGRQKGSKQNEKVENFNLKISSKHRSLTSNKESNSASPVAEDQELRKLLHYLQQILETDDSKFMNQKILRMQQFLLN